jgi:phosphohistidine phosphatase
MRLYLVQHGAALDKQEDPARALSRQGVQEVTRMAKVLGGAGVHVERVWHSGKRRAEQTATILASQLMPEGNIDRVTGIDPLDPVQEFVADADVWLEDTLVVGHLPFLSRTVSLLLCGEPDRELVSYLPGSVVCLERGRAGQWTLLWMLRPGLHDEVAT